jgi:DNA-binding transcriptional MerR regulator
MANEMNASSDAATTSPSDYPVYNIGVVVQMTGIPAATLRAWERRYGFPVASRSAGGHRLYSNAEVTRLRWVKDRVDEGFQPSQAVVALRLHEEAEGRLPDEAAPPARSGVTGSLAVGTVLQHLLAALTDHDTEQADQVLQDAVAALDPETLILSVVAPVMEELGDLWSRGEISIATEHLATNYLRQKLLMWLVTAPPPRDIAPIALACAPGELHEGSLLILATLLRRRLHPIAYLGQSMPLSDLAELVADIEPAVVVLLAMREETAEEIIGWPEFIRTGDQQSGPIVAFGGRVFSEQPDWRQKVPGVFLGTTIMDGLKSIERLTRSGSASG